MEIGLRQQQYTAAVNSSSPAIPTTTAAPDSNEAKKVFPCSLCDKKFSYKNGLLRHVRLTHAKEKPYECDICFKKFGYKHILQEHQNLHYGNKPYACQYCDKKFAARSNLVQHRNVHKRPYICPLCKKRFTEEDKLRAHIDTHPRASLTCTICKYDAESQSDLTKHLVEVHAPAMTAQTANRKERSASQSSDKSQYSASPSSSVSMYPSQSQTLLIPTAPTMSLPVQVKREEPLVAVNPMNLMGPPTVSLPTIDAIFSQRPMAGALMRPVFGGLVGHTMFPTSPPSMRPSPISPPMIRTNPASPSSSNIPLPSPRSVYSLTGSDRCLPSTTMIPTKDSSTQYCSELPGYPDLDQVISYYVSRGQIFKCRYCNILFYERGMYFLHASLHGTLSPWECSICHVVCADKNEFTLHFVNQQHA